MLFLEVATVVPGARDFYRRIAANLVEDGRGLFRTPKPSVLHFLDREKSRKTVNNSKTCDIGTIADTQRRLRYHMQFHGNQITKLPKFCPKCGNRIRKIWI